MRSYLYLGLLFSLLLTGIATADTVYRWVDENGKVHYSDTPVKNAQEYESKENTLNQVKVNHSNLPTTKAQAEPGIQYQVTVISPTEEATVRDNNGDFSATASVMPETPKGAKLQLILDGTPHGPAQSANHFNLKAIDRGEHQLVVQLIDQSGKVLASSPTRRVFLHQANIQPKVKPKAN